MTELGSTDLKKVEIFPEFSAPAYYGEQSLFASNDVIPLSPLTLQCRGYCELIQVRRDEFDVMLSQTPQFFEEVAKLREMLQRGDISPSVFGCGRCGGPHETLSCVAAEHQVMDLQTWQRVSANTAAALWAASERQSSVNGRFKTV